MYEPTPDGQVEVISGCMYAGKTSELLSRIERAEIADKSVLCFTPEVDDRSEITQIATHTDSSRTAHTVDATGDLEEVHEVVADAASEPDIVVFDEANFFSQTLISTVQGLAEEGMRVIVSGLDQTFRGEVFEPVGNLLAIADDVTKLSAVCSVCGKQASRTQRLIDGEPAPYESQTVLVGGEEAYEARCRNCHTVPRKNQSS